MNRPEIWAGILILGFGVWRLVMLLLSISSTSHPTGIIAGAAPIISLTALEDEIVIIWATSSAGVGLIVDGLHRKLRPKTTAP